MAFLLLGLLFMLAMVGHSSGASYCLCKDGLSDSVLQKNINYACGSGADCSAINQGGSCFNPNTVKDHCNYAVNSYFQKKGEASGSCDFSSTAAVSPTPPAITNGCVYPSSGSGGTPSTPTTPGTGSPGTGTPGTGTPGTGTPGMGTPGTGTPGTGTPSTGTPGTGTPSTGTPGTGTPSTGTPGTGTPSTGTPGTGTPGTGTPSTGMPSTSTPPGMGTPGFGTGTPSTTVPGTSPFLGLGPTGGISNTNPDNSGMASLRQSTNMFYSIILTLLFSSFFCFGALKQE